MKGCRHRARRDRNWRQVYVIEGGTQQHRLMYFDTCARCGTWLPLGPSDETPVAVEVRAAEIAADCVPDLADALAVESDDEAIGWALHRDATTPGHGVVRELHEAAIVDGVPRSAAAESGWLAREIYDALHDIEQGESI